jgi:hypothetical protein
MLASLGMKADVVPVQSAVLGNIQRKRVKTDAANAAF